jgi:hypothetical protein
VVEATVLKTGRATVGDNVTVVRSNGATGLRRGPSVVTARSRASTEPAGVLSW